MSDTIFYVSMLYIMIGVFIITMYMGRTAPIMKSKIVELPRGDFDIPGEALRQLQMIFSTSA